MVGGSKLCGLQGHLGGDLIDLLKYCYRFQRPLPNKVLGGTALHRNQNSGVVVSLCNHSSFTMPISSLTFSTYIYLSFKCNSKGISKLTGPSLGTASRCRLDSNGDSLIDSWNQTQVLCPKYHSYFVQFDGRMSAHSS